MTDQPGKNRELSESSKSGFESGVAQELQKRRDRIVWSIAGFDPGSGAGITADLMTFAAHGLFGCSAVTALTVQTTVGVFGVEPMPKSVLGDSLERLAEDLPPLGIKIGMLATQDVAETVVRALTKLGDEPSRRPVIVLDPVLRSSSGKELYPNAGLSFLQEALLPLVGWVTPNWSELEVLSGKPVRDLDSATGAAQTLIEHHPQLHVVATGGDQHTPVDMLVSPGGEVLHFRGARVETRSTHGTGCAFSSSLLSHLVLQREPADAVRRAKAYVEGALRWAPGLGAGRGPMELLWPLLKDRGQDC